jgi:hypothetical protein
MPYSTDTELTAYATARGYTLVGDPDVLLIRANDWLETLTFRGVKTDPQQEAQFPRRNLVVQGRDIPDDEIPLAVKRAEMQMAMEIDQGRDPFAPTPRTVIKEKVDTLEVEYSDTGNDVPSINSVMPLLKGYVLATGGVTLVRGY